MDIFAFVDYRKIIRNWVANKPNRGRGELLKMSNYLNILNSTTSQILNGSRELTDDQAYLLSQYMMLLPLETEYFVTLVQIQRAQHHQFKTFLKEKLDAIKHESLNLSKRVSHYTQLPEKAQLVFYSSWVYSAIRMFTAIGNGKTADEIQQHFNLSKERFSKIIDFLLKHGLITQSENLYQVGHLSTYLDRDSPMISRHHTNWRNRAIERSGDVMKDEMMYTTTFACSSKDFAQIREKITALIKETSEIVQKSDSVETVYFGVDFLKF